MSAPPAASRRSHASSELARAILASTPLVVVATALALAMGCSQDGGLAPLPYRTSVLVPHRGLAEPENRFAVREESRPVLPLVGGAWTSEPFAAGSATTVELAVAIEALAPADFAATAVTDRGRATATDGGRAAAEREAPESSPGSAELRLSLLSETTGDVVASGGAPLPVDADTGFRVVSVPLSGAGSGGGAGDGTTLGSDTRLRVEVRAPAELLPRVRVSAPRLLAPARPLRARPVVVVCADALRADHLSLYGYARETSPRLDAFARGAAVVERAYAGAGWTLPAISTLLTGRLPSGHGAYRNTHALSPIPPTLAEILGRSGYRTAAVVSGSYTAPRFGLARGFDRYEDLLFSADSLEDANEKRTSELVTDRALAILDEMKEDLFFLFLHYFDAHRDYVPPPPYDRMFDPAYRGGLDGRVGFGKSPGFRPDMSRRDLEHVTALYDGEIRYLDEHLGRLLDAVPPDVIVVFTADHGEAFFEHGFAGHGAVFGLHEELVRIPFVLRLPGGVAPAPPEGGLRLPGPASGADLVPTILDALGLENPPCVEGRSLLPDVLGRSAPEEPRAIVESFDWVSGEPIARAYVSGSWKWIESFPGARRKAPKDALYDLAGDPREARNAAFSGSARVAALREACRALEATFAPCRRAVASGSAVELTDEMKRALDGLGYGGGTAEPAAPSETGQPPDAAESSEEPRPSEVRDPAVP